MYPSSDLDALSPPAYILPRASPIKVCVYTQVLLTYREWFQSTTLLLPLSTQPIVCHCHEGTPVNSLMLTLVIPNAIVGSFTCKVCCRCTHTVGLPVCACVCACVCAYICVLCLYVCVVCAWCMQAAMCVWSESTRSLASVCVRAMTARGTPAMVLLEELQDYKVLGAPTR